MLTWEIILTLSNGATTDRAIAVATALDTASKLNSWRLERSLSLF